MTTNQLVINYRVSTVITHFHAFKDPSRLSNLRLIIRNVDFQEVELDQKLKSWMNTIRPNVAIKILHFETLVWQHFKTFLKNYRHPVPADFSSPWWGKGCSAASGQDGGLGALGLEGEQRSCPGPGCQVLRGEMQVPDGVHVMVHVMVRGRVVWEAHVGAEAGPETGWAGLEGQVRRGSVGWSKGRRSLVCGGWWRGTMTHGLNLTWSDLEGIK